MLFRADDTHRLVGMAGELGQSPAEWVIKSRVRNVVLISRTPKRNPTFVEVMEKKYRALIKAFSLEVALRQSTENVRNVITSTLPCISGIVNGAIVLEEKLFANMTLENLNYITAPVMLNTQLLDQAFHNDTWLEFFIAISGIASIIGYTVQSFHPAADEEITSLVRNKRARGVPAATMSI